MNAFRIILTIILLIYSVPTILSALDIHKGTEPDLTSEWVVVSVFISLSIILSVINLLELLKYQKKNR